MVERGGEREREWGVRRGEGFSIQGCSQTQCVKIVKFEREGGWRGGEWGEVGSWHGVWSVFSLRTDRGSHSFTLVSFIEGKSTCEAGLPQESPSKSQSVSGSLGAQN